MVASESDWYSPSSIKFSRPEIIWILENIEMIEEGRWPPDFKYTGYTGGNKGRRFGPAYFEAPCSISAEVKRRLVLTKQDGKILFWQIKAGITTFESLESEAKCALNFVSLWDFRKRPRYSFWKRDRKYYYKNVGKGLK